MYLKRIEAIGFKSFATKAIINFDKGLTAIVGPNGSGKSNVSDAIRFVLGEQSVKSLRGGKMEDIIFAGTDDKKALNMAEVTIVLDNEARHLPLDFSEVSITRRVYRSGSGEYLINGEKIRLKDVTNLIMDSGIGHDSLSMISQDQVKQVIEGKPEDRRLILEESAGILKYKTRKKEAVRKLGYVCENLQRVKDIIGELENQIEPLRTQAKQAKDYLAIKEQLSDLEIRLLAHDIKVDNEQLNELKREYEDLTIKLLEATKQSETNELTQTRLTDEHNNLNNQVQDLQFELMTQAEDAQKKRGDADVIKERIAGAGVNKTQLTERKQELETSLAKLQQDVIEAKSQAQEASRILYEKQQDNKEAYRIKHIIPLEELLREQVEKYKELDSALAEHESEHANLNDQFQHATYQLSSAKNQLGFLLDAKEDFALFSEGTKQVLRAKKSGTLLGIEGAIAELVTVPAEYEVAFDVILSPTASQVITKNDSSARKAIEYLKKNRLGRATFLPLNIMKSRRLAPDLLAKAQAHTGFITLASDALTCDKKHRHIIENLVGNVVIAKDLTSANEIAKSVHHRFRIVTLAGDVINPGGSMTGGATSRKSNSTVLKQDRQISKQKELISKLNKSMQDLEIKKQEGQQKISTLQEEIAICKSDLSTIQLKLTDAKDNSLRSSYELKIEVATLEANLQNHLNEVSRLNAECEKTQTELETARETLTTSDLAATKLQESYMRIEKEIAKADIEKENITTKIREDRQQLVHLAECLKTLEVEIRGLRRLINDVNGSLNKLSGDIGKLDIKLDIGIQKLEKEYEMTFDYASLHYPLRKDVAATRAEVQKLNRQATNFNAVNIGAIDEYKRVKERHNFLESESSDLTLAASNLQSSIDEMDISMVTKFKETFDQVRLRYIETFSELFGGGHADLLLTDPSDLLTTGVEIIARPPGTKLGTSTLLSGGQKALTSIAMLFAILKVRIIPFCILDEVEAALDEANVARYAKHLKHFSDQTQFIVITHRRGTMEEADTLYGVTMQERGITKMVSVRMDTIDEFVS